MRRRKRRGQMEIMGVAVIVLLISVGFMFFLKFSLSKEDKTVQKDFQKATIPTYFINAFLETSISEDDCNIRGKMKDLVADCVENGGAPWDGYSDPDDFSLDVETLDDYNGQEASRYVLQCGPGVEDDENPGKYLYPPTSCGYLYKILESMFEGTLVEQGKSYIFTLEGSDAYSGEYIMMLSSGDCDVGSEFKEFVLANQERITLTICD